MAIPGLPKGLKALLPGGDRRQGVETPAFVELKHGMFTASGTWFHTTTADLERYAAVVLGRVTIERLISDAESLMRSPQTMSLWSLLVALAFASPIEAALVAVVVFLGWSVLSPGLVTLPLVKLYRWLESVPLQGIAYVVVLSLLAGRGQFPALWTGLAGFVLIRWGIVERLVDPAAGWLRRSLYRLPLPDQALRAVIVRHALATGAPLAELETMERRMLDIAARRAQPRRKDPG